MQKITSIVSTSVELLAATIQNLDDQAIVRLDLLSRFPIISKHYIDNVTASNIDTSLIHEREIQWKH